MGITAILCRTTMSSAWRDPEHLSRQKLTPAIPYDETRYVCSVNKLYESETDLQDILVAALQRSCLEERARGGGKVESIDQVVRDLEVGNRARLEPKTYQIAYDVREMVPCPVTKSVPCIKLHTE